jgi:Helix-turn-helix domain
LGACVRGSSAWTIWQLLRDPLRTRIRQLEVDPGVHRDVVRQLQGTAADLELAAREYREWESARAAKESIEVPPGGVDAVLDRPSLRWDTGSAAASLGCSERWVTQLCLTGRLAAVKRGRSWFIDPESVGDYKRKGANAA